MNKDFGFGLEICVCGEFYNKALLKVIDKRFFTL